VAGESVFERHAWRFIERNISVVPIAPGSKRPGRWSEAGGWEGMGDWTRFAQRMPTEIELKHWGQWPDAGIGVVLGELSGVIGLDRDYDVPGASDALDKLIPFSPVAKKGEKGWTKFYRYNGERSCSFNVQGHRVLDVLSNGRQTVVPPTAHPSGCSYVWITVDTLDDITSVSDLPTLPDDFLAQVEALLAPYQNDTDKKYQRKTIAPNEDTSKIDTGLSIQAQYFSDLNRAALTRLDEWVERLIPTAKTNKDGFRAVATWRGAKNPNVGIHPSGIFDFGGNYGMTPIDLVMYSNGLPFAKAAETLRGCLALSEPEPITLGGATPTQSPSEPTAPASMPTMPWRKPAAPAASVAPPPAIILPATTSEAPAKAIPAFITDPPGILADMAGWITATAPKSQPELSLAAAIAMAAACTQRIYRSNLSNFTSLYLVMVAKSTEGKEHPQSCVERVLTAAGLEHLVAGSGYTSSGAVFSALLRQPAHLAIIDEIGKLLKLSRAKGNANSEAAIDKLVEAFGKLNGVMRPPVYSTMTMTQAQVAASSVERVIHNPAVSLLGATTPATFWSSLTDDLIQDGFLGRLIVVESSQPRQLARFVDQTDPPARVVEWCQAVNAPAQRQGDLASRSLAELEPVTVSMTISDGCQDVMRSFESELNKLKDAFEAEGLDVLLGRTFEKALRLAMIAAKARDAGAARVELQDLEWAISYIRHYDMALVRAVRKNRVRSQTDADTKRVLEYLKAAKSFAGEQKNPRLASVLATGAMPHALLLKKMHMKSREFTELMNTLVEAGIVMKSPGAHLHYAGDVYFTGEE
jgi:hypothetical protein